MRCVWCQEWYPLHRGPLNDGCVWCPSGTPGSQGQLQAGLHGFFFPDFFFASLLMPSQGLSKAQDGLLNPSRASLQQL